MYANFFIHSIVGFALIGVFQIMYVSQTRTEHSSYALIQGYVHAYKSCL